MEKVFRKIATATVAALVLGGAVTFPSSSVYAPTTTETVAAVTVGKMQSYTTPKAETKLQDETLHLLLQVEATKLPDPKPDPKPEPKPEPEPEPHTPTLPPNAPPASPGTAQAYAKELLLSQGHPESEYTCLYNLWERESNWNYQAMNSSSGAYGIPQSLPGSKMSSAGADWQTNPETQIRWGLSYIKDRYQTPCGAWAQSEAVGWY